MSKRTLALVGILLFVTLGLVAIAVIPQPAAKPTPTPPPEARPTPPLPAQTVLSISPNPIVVSPNSSGSANILIDTGENQVTAVQFEITFDPKVIGNVDVAPGTFFANPLVLLRNVAQKKGTVSFAIGIQPTGNAKRGQGSVATLTFQVVSSTSQSSPLTFREETLVTATGATASVLKTALGSSIFIKPAPRLGI